jgi:hypothetical protein
MADLKAAPRAALSVALMVEQKADLTVDVWAEQ